ncbi:MAG: ATP synthase F0 subunit A [Bacteroidetes bacterium]|nr:MAG: ATP synthase F0 subunit A [Bacteroidota bacterium]
MCVFLPRFFEPSRSMIFRHIKRLSFTALYLGASFFTFAQTEGHDSGAMDSHATQEIHATHEEHAFHNSEAEEHGSFVAGDFIIHHIADANEIHFFGDINVPLPMIFYVEGKGFDVFMSSEFKSEGHGHNAHAIKMATGPNTGTTYTKDPDTGISAQGGEVFWDISITKSVFGMFFILIMLIVVLRSMAKSYSKKPGTAPTGLANALEPLVLFVKDDIAVPIIGKGKADKFLPFLLTTFFFIVASNLLGLIPFIGGFNITGTIGVTIVLAFFVFVISTVSGNKNYWGHLFSPPGVPNAVKLIVVPIEIFGVFLKPAVLMIRLTANISAGHIIILSFVSLIFIFNQNFGAGGGIGIGVFSTLFMIFMNLLELLVAFLQAYVFTLLAAIYFADATQEAHH